MCWNKRLTLLKLRELDMHGFGDCFFIVFWGLICDGKAENYMYTGKTMQSIIFFIKSTFRNQ